MRIAKTEIPIKIDGPGATARQRTDFGDATGYGTMGGELFTLAAGTDLTPLLQGLEDDLCQAPHWGYVIEGEVTAIYRDGAEERARAGDLIYWPPGHTVRAEKNTEFVLFSPQQEHTKVLDHVKTKAGA
jgi:uncharacterized cupin superfamily protein